MGDKTHGYYKHTKFRQNPRGDPKFLVIWYGMTLKWAEFFSSSLFDALAREMPFGILLVDLPALSFVYHSSLLTAKCFDLVVACDGFLS